MMFRSRLWFIGLALTLSGCLLPQPDTPVIPPVAPNTSRAQAPSKDAVPAQAPAAAPAESGTIANNAGGLISNSAGGLISNNAGGLIADNTGKSGPAIAAPVAASDAAASATLKGQLSGMTVKTVVAVSEVEGLASSGVEVNAGAFTMQLSPGGYYLDLVLTDGKTLRVDKRLVVQSGESRSLTITLQANPPKATIAEDAPLVSPSPSPSPSNKL
jgi:hypothetical protein